MTLMGTNWISHKTSSLALLIPAYNAAGLLPRLLASAAAQTEPFDEIWVYDDCSTDDTAAVAEGLGARMIRGAVNRGCSHGKNALAHHTTCTWIHFHDADDELLPNFVALARGWMSTDGNDVVLFPYLEIDDVTDQPIAVRQFEPEAVARNPICYAIRNQINPFCGLYRREAFLAAGGCDEDPLVLYNEDVAMHIALAFAGLSFAAETTVSIVNRRRVNSMSASNRQKCIEAHYHVLRKVLDRPRSTAYRNDIATKLWMAGAAGAAHLDWATADKAVALAMRLADPSAAPARSVFQALCWLSPHIALRARELLIRLFRPHLRAGYPTWHWRALATTRE